MRNLANKEERNTKVNQLGQLAFEILPSILNDGYVDSRDIEALRNQKGVGEWSVEQLQQLCDTGAWVMLRYEKPSGSSTKVGHFFFQSARCE